MKTESKQNGDGFELSIMHRDRTSPDWSIAAYAECDPIRFKSKARIWRPFSALTGKWAG